MSMQGTVKFFNFSKGYGFISPADGSEDLFIHATDVAGNPLKEADEVTFDTKYDDRKGKTQACNVQGGSGWPVDDNKGKGKGKGFGGGGYW